MDRLEKLKRGVLKKFRKRINKKTTKDEAYDIKYEVLEEMKGLEDKTLGIIKIVEIEGNEVDIRKYLDSILRGEIKNEFS